MLDDSTSCNGGGGGIALLLLDWTFLDWRIDIPFLVVLLLLRVDNLLSS